MYRGVKKNYLKEREEVWDVSEVSEVWDVSDVQKVQW
jgi:hypothetical protein